VRAGAGTLRFGLPPPVGTLARMEPLLAAVRRLATIVVLTLLTVVSTATLVLAQTEADAADAPAGDARVVEVLPLRGGFIDPPVTAQIRDVLDLAEEQGSELVVLQYSSPGGVSVDLDEVLARLRASTVPVAVLVGPLGVGAEAGGAAGVLWLGAHLRAVALDGSVGPIDPPDLAVTADATATRQLVAAELERIGADPDLTEALLTSAVGAEDLDAAGVVTLSAQGIEPLLVDLDGRTVATADGERTLSIRADEVQVRFHSLGLVRRLLHAATTAPFIYLLLVVGLGMLLFEVFQPGFGVAGIAGLVTLAIGVFGLTVLPVTWWAVALVVLGLLLYALDTALAGFGPLTLGATVAFAVGSWAFYDAEVLALPWWLIAATTVAAFAFFVFVMTSILRAQAGPEGVSVDDLVGRPGIVRSVLNPEGHVYIDGALWRARWTGDTRRAKVGTPVKVHAVDGPVVLVEPFEADAEVAARSATPADTDAGRGVGDDEVATERVEPRS
jgi:membrane-bound serine protease (ClpP class)